MKHRFFFASIKRPGPNGPSFPVYSSRIFSPECLKRNAWGLKSLVGILFLLGIQCARMGLLEKSFRAQNYRETLSLSAHRLTQDPTDAEAWLFRMRAFAALDSINATYRTVEEALAHRPQDARLRSESARILLAVGKRCQAYGEEKDARRVVLLAEQTDPDFTEATLFLADQDEREGRLDEAVKRIESTIDRIQDPTPWLNKLNLLESRIRLAEELAHEAQAAFTARHFERAMTGFEKASGLYPARSEFAYGAAMSRGFFFMGRQTRQDRETAREAFSLASRIRPDAAEPHYWKARLLEMEDKMALLPQAIAEYETALRLEPEGPFAQTCREKRLTLQKRLAFWRRRPSQN